MIDLAAAARPLPSRDCSAGSIAVLLSLKIPLWTIKSGGKRPWAGWASGSIRIHSHPAASPFLIFRIPACYPFCTKELKQIPIFLNES